MNKFAPTSGMFKHLCSFTTKVPAVHRIALILALMPTLSTGVQVFCAPSLLSSGLLYSLSATAEDSSEKAPIAPNRFSELTGIKGKNSLQKMWDARYESDTYVYGRKPAKFLEENYRYISENAKVLDVGMGAGRNAVFLAQKGMIVTGIDISSVAVQKALKLANENSVRIRGIVSSWRDFSPKDGEFDAIICFYFVDRELNKKLIKWLRPGGILIYETYTTNQLKVKGFNPNNYSDNDFLKPQELLTLFSSTIILKYEEPLHDNNFYASIILKKK